MRQTVNVILALVFLAALPLVAQQKSFTIANGASLSGAVDMQSCTPARIIINPSGAASGWTAANLTFQSSEDGVTFGKLTDEFGTEAQVTVDSTAAASGQVTIRLSPGDWWILRWLKIRSGTSGTPVAQGAERTIRVVCR